MKTEYTGSSGFLQRDGVEHKEYAEAYSAETQKAEERDGADLLEKVLDRDNLNRAYRRVKANKGASGVDGMTVDEALPWLKEHREELLESIRNGKYKPSPVRRVEIPKDNGGVRKLGIPTVIDRIIQQAIAQVLTPIYEPKFSDGSYGYRPHRSAKDAILKVKKYADEGYRYAVCLDLSKYFDTLNHELLMNMLRQEVKDKRLTDLIKKYLKSGVMENGIVMKTEEGSPQGGNLSPLLANIMLNELDKEMEKRGLNFVRYADDCIIMVGSEMSANRVMRNISRFIEEKLGLKVNMTKSKVDRPSGLKYLGFGFYFDPRAHQFKAKPHAKSVAKFKKRMKELTCRSWGVSNSYKVEKLNQLIRGWINYFKIGSMKTLCKELDSRIRYRLRMCIWKQWKTPQNQEKNLVKLGIDRNTARRVAYTGKRIAYVCNKGAVNVAISNKRLASFGLISMLDYYIEKCVTC